MPDFLIFHLRGKDLLCKGARCLIHLCKKEQSAGLHRHLVLSHPNRQVPLAVSLMLSCHFLMTHTPPCCLEDSEQPSKFATSLQRQGHTQWSGDIPRHPQSTRKGNTTHSPRVVQKCPERSKSLGKAFRRACTGGKRRGLAEPLTALGSLRPTYSTRLPVRMKTDV